MNGWVIRVYLHVLIEKIKRYKNNPVIDLDSAERINDLIERNGDYIFNDAVLYDISWVFIEGITNSTEKDPEKLFAMIKTFFNKLNVND
ncbi:hypothetical protein [Dickeya sp. DW 0440]|uniref:hypothetical protein n=1 Tax=Dickeya sp. DW 0440 TaxID=1225785 RepID=UPI001EE6844D|nr:hypothetical protein [Dickeya sp. DW 0440]